MDENLRLTDFETYRSALFPVELGRGQDVLGAHDPHHLANPVDADQQEVLVSSEDGDFFTAAAFRSLVLEKIVYDP
jgi:hypothetical protein